MADFQTLEVSIQGMDCAECTRHVQHAIAALPGVQKVDVYLAAEKAVVDLDPQVVDLPAIRKAVEGAGYGVAEAKQSEEEAATERRGYTRPLMFLLGGLFVFILLAVILGEWMGFFEIINDLVPLWIGLALVIGVGFPVFRNVIRAALKGKVLAHTLMTIGIIAALLVGQWVTALMVAVLMRVGDFVERFTTERARQAVRDLAALAPGTARVERDGNEVEIPASRVQAGEVVIVRPGEKIPVDGEVIAGQATVNQAAITGEAMPVEVGEGSQVYAATLAQLGSLRIRTRHSGEETTFGQIIHLVEEAELQKAPVERIADKFSAYYLPVVGSVAGITFLISRDPLATAAVLVVACSCAFALATPIAMLASVGAGARRGLMIKGGKYLEQLARADVVLIDKTGTLTLGKPQIVDHLWVIGDRGSIIGDQLSGTSYQSSAISSPQLEMLRLAASAERYSEHPLAEAVREAAQAGGLALEEVEDFQAIPGQGVRARVGGRQVEVGNGRVLVDDGFAPQGGRATSVSQSALAGARGWQESQEALGRTVLQVKVDGRLSGLLAATDTLRPEVPEAIEELRALGITQIELLTGDNERTAAELANRLRIAYRANLLPKDKIEIVKAYQAQKHVVVMVGDGVNDAPALAQADVGMAMGAAGSDAAIEAAHIALMRQDWRLAPDAIRIARRTMRVVKGNIGFTAVYNVLGLTLAALGILPPVLAAAAQSIPDLVILGNSSRLIRQK